MPDQPILEADAALGAPLAFKAAAVEDRQGGRRGSNQQTEPALKEKSMTERQSVNFPGFSHQNPIPNASRVGTIVMASVIGGSSPGTRELPPTLEA